MKKGKLEMEKLTEMLQKLDVGQREMKKDLSQEIADMKQELNDLKSDIKEEFAGLKKDFKDVKQMSEENRKRVEDLERGWKGAQGGQKNLESMVLNLQLEKSLLFLRFQNVLEEEEEDLKDKMSKILADYTGKELERVRWDIDQAYRVNSQYAKTHNVPREIHVKFIKMETRDEILRVQRGRPLTHRGKEILILKQIPKKIRETRKKYFFLSKKLYPKGIMFRWLVPEGLLIIWEGRRIRIDSVEQAQAFLRDHGSFLEETGTGMEEGEIGEDRGREGGGEAGKALGAEGGGRSQTCPG